MFEVRCEGCNAPFQLDERRIPKIGMRMRCPQCGASFLVRRPEGADAGGNLPTPMGPGGAGLPASKDAMGLPLPVDAGTSLPLPRDPAASLPLPRDLASALPLPRDPAASLPLPKDLAASMPNPRVSPKATQPQGSAVEGEVPELFDDFELDLPMSSAELPNVRPPDTRMLASQTPVPEVDARAAASFGGPSAEESQEAGQRESKEAFKLGRIGLERKAFAVPSNEDLPALPRNANLPAPKPARQGTRNLRNEDFDFGGLDAGPVYNPAPPPVAPKSVPPPVPPAARPPPPPPAPADDFLSLDPGSPISLSDEETTNVSQAYGGSDPFAPGVPKPGQAPTTRSSLDDDFALPPSYGTPADLSLDFDSAPAAPARPPPAAPPPSTAHAEAPHPPAPSRPKSGLFREIKAAERAAPAEPRTSQKQKVLYGALGFLAVVGLGGAMLAVTDYGAFGKNYFDDVIHGPERHAAAARVILMVEGNLEHDTYDRAIAGLRRLDQALARVPKEKGLAAYVVYANNLVVARFGADPALTGRAHSLFAQLANAPEETDYLRLARASDALARHNARDALNIAKNDPRGKDLAALAAFELGRPEEALRIARSQRQDRPSARARYLLARALYETGDRMGARREAEDVLRHEPRHAGARILVARIIGQTESGRERALDLVRDIDRAGARGASLGERAEAAVLAGQMELSRDHVSAARQKFEHALELDPRSAAALVGIGSILYRQGSYTDALARFRNAYSADHSNIEAVIGIAKSCLALNNATDARSAIEPTIAGHPTDARLHFWFGMALAGLEERTTAEREFREVIRLQPENLDAYIELNKLLIHMYRPDAAEQVLREAQAHVPDGAAIHRAFAYGRLARADLEGAETELHTALRREPNDLASHYALGDVYRRERRLDDAEREFDFVAQIDSDYPGLALARGQLAEARGQLADALNTFREALARDPTNVEFVIRVASTLVTLGNFGEADQMLRQVVVDHPSNAEAQYILGRARLGQDNYVDSVHYLDRAIELNPNRADFKAFAAEAHRRTGDITRAIQLAEQSIELDPTFPRGYWVRAEIHVHQGDASGALADVRHAIALDPRLWAAYATYGDVDDSLGHPSEAITLYQLATRNDDRHGEWFYTLGRLLTDGGRTGEARTALGRALSLGAGTPPPPPRWYLQSMRLMADIERVSGNEAEARRLYQQLLGLFQPGSPSYQDVQTILIEMAQH